MPSLSPIHAVALPVVGWIILLAGLGLYQDEQLMVKGAPSAVKSAARDYWWTVSLEFAVLAGG